MDNNIMMAAPRWKAVNEDCLVFMKRTARLGSQVDSIVTDPPYHLSTVKRFGKAGAAPPKSDGATGVYKRAAKGFMGKTWDGGDVAFDPATWRLAYDLLKPGGHLIAFGGARTYHRMAVAIEDAGFEIRDQLMWLYGTGFPKSHDVSKGIDKSRKEDAEPVRVVCRHLRAAMDAKGVKSKDLVVHFGDCHPRLVDHWAARDTDSQPNLPTWEQWLVLKQVLSLDDDVDAEVWRLNGRKGKPGDAWTEADVLGEHEGVPGGFGEHRFSNKDKTIREPSPEARQWEGWGTALKPAHEPIVLARKPLEGTVAQNVLKHGVGALNIDASRVMGGRWPANVVHDGGKEVEGMLGEPSRFFYCAKANATDRMGSTHPTVKPVALMRWLVRMVTPPGGTVLDPFAGSGTTGQAAVEQGMKVVLVEADETYYADLVKRMEAVNPGSH